MLLRSALEDVALHVSADAPAMPVSALETLARQYMEFQTAAKRSSRRYDLHVLEQMLHVPELTAADREDADKLAAWGSHLSALLECGAAGRAHVRSHVAAAARRRTWS